MSYRDGEDLWMEWTGLGYDCKFPMTSVYFTIGDIDLDEEVVYRALAFALQRDGVSDSFRDGLNMMDRAVKSKLLGGVEIDGDGDYSICDPYGKTINGDEVIEILNINIVEIPWYCP